jgi:hypothetical protein
MKMKNGTRMLAMLAAVLAIGLVINVPASGMEVVTHELFNLTFDSPDTGTSLFSIVNGGGTLIDTTVGALGAGNNAGANASGAVYGELHDAQNFLITQHSYFAGSDVVNYLNTLGLNHYSDDYYTLVFSYDQLELQDNPRMGIIFYGDNSGAPVEALRGSAGNPGVWYAVNPSNTGSINQDPPGDNLFSHIIWDEEVNGYIPYASHMTLQFKIIDPLDAPQHINEFRAGSFTGLYVQSWLTQSTAGVGEAYYDNVRLQISYFIPEPATALLLGLPVIGLLVRRRKTES